MIENKLIKDIACNLGNVAKEMEQDIANAKKNMKLVGDFETLYIGLKEVAYKLSKEIPNYKRDLKEIDATLKELDLLDDFDTTDPNSDEDALLYAKAQSMISHNDNMSDSASVGNLNKKVEDLLANMKSLLRNVGKKEICEDEKEIKTDTKAMEGSRILSESGMESKLSMPVRRESVENIVLKIDDKLVPVSSIDLDLNDVENSAKKLALAEKFCETCKQFTPYAIILNCYCVICLDCLQKSIKERNSHILNNVFEATKENLDGMCACPKHNVTIDISILGKVFGCSVIEEASIEALRRQSTFGSDRSKLCFLICPVCKELIKSVKTSIEVVHGNRRIRVCRDCSK
eukprot:TRINITY_DN277_c0_g2_i3.p1 TRINITY_DN277_c0_g2~~TRINITY_DN277_c0_g2_i3.p1  ORF type:complete len:346 (+),score=78.33 TRINITY_DN277_c0_g2_i3:99-1136(+)